MNIFISQPMKGKTDAEIQREREKATLTAVREYGSDVKILDSYIRGFTGNPVQYLGRAVELLGSADAAMFLPGWKDARGCRIERAVCKEYGIPVCME